MVSTFEVNVVGDRIALIHDTACTVTISELTDEHAAVLQRQIGIARRKAAELRDTRKEIAR